MIQKREHPSLAGLLVAAAALAVYANSLGNGFVWDDWAVVTRNPALRGYPMALFSQTDVISETSPTPYYRPLALLTFLFQIRLQGLEPFAMHLVNVLLHTMNTFLVFRLAKVNMENVQGAFFASLLFAIHPANTEAVNFISGGRNTLLSCFFSLAAYLVHRKSIEGSRTVLAVGGALLFLGGLLCKETTLGILPFICAAEFRHYRLRRIGGGLRSLVRLLPYGAAVIGYLVMRWKVFAKLGVGGGLIPGLGMEGMDTYYLVPSLWSRLLDNVYIIPKYLWTLLYPVALSPKYNLPDNYHLLALPLFVTWILIIAALAWVLTRGRSGATIFGLFWLLVFWLPTSGIIWIPSGLLADRYLYVPAIGLWLIIGDQSRRWLPDSGEGRRYGMVATAVVLILLSVVTVRRNLDWNSDLSLFSRAAEQYPDNPWAHAVIGEIYLNRNQDNDLNLAEHEFLTALALESALPGVRTKLGHILKARGDLEGAVESYGNALAIDPLQKEARFNRALLLERLGRLQEARDEYRLFLETPGHAWSEARPYAESRFRALSP